MTEEKLVSMQVTQDVKAAETIASALNHYQSAQPEWAKKLGPKAAAALETLFEELGPRVKAAGQELEVSEQGLNQERQDDEPVRTARDASSESLNKAILRVKGLVSATFDEDALITYGLSSAVPGTPDGRRTYARNAAALLRKDARIELDSLGRETNTAMLAALLEQAAAPLDQARADETREALELNEALVKRDGAADALGELTSFSKGLLDLSLRLVGQDRAADKLAVRLRARKGAAADAEEPLPVLEPIAWALNTAALGSERCLAPAPHDLN